MVEKQKVAYLMVEVQQGVDSSSNRLLVHQHPVVDIVSTQSKGHLVFKRYISGYVFIKTIIKGFGSEDSATVENSNALYFVIPSQKV